MHLRPVSPSVSAAALTALGIAALAMTSHAQAPLPPDCRPPMVILSGPVVREVIGVTLRICRDVGGSTDLLAEVYGDENDGSADRVSTGTLLFTAHELNGTTWRFTVDGSARRAIVTRQLPDDAATQIPADSAPWRASVLPSAGNVWRVYAAWPSALAMDSVEYTAPDGRRWSRSDVESFAQLTQLSASPPPAPLPVSGPADGGLSGGWSILGVANAASPAPYAPRLGARASLGAIATHSSPEREITVAVAPPRPVFGWAPIQANPNQRGRRILPDGRPEMEPWRMERGRFIWLDTRRIDRGLGFAHLYGDESPVGALVTVAETGDLSAAAIRAGKYGEGPLALRVAAAREDPAPGGYRARHPWLLIGGLSGDIQRAETQTDSATAGETSLPPTPRTSLHWEWNATAPATSPDRRMGAALLDAIIPVGGPFVMTAYHERLAPEFGSRGAAFAPLDGIEVSEVGLLARTGRSRVEIGVDLLAPFHRSDPLSGIPYDDPSREMRARARWISPRSARGELSLEGSVGAYRYDGRRLGPYPGGSVTYTADQSRALRWQLFAHAEGTPLFAELAPARAGGVRASVERHAERHATLFFVAAERVDACGAGLASFARSGTGVFPPASRASREDGRGCDVAGDALAFSALHRHLIGSQTSVEVEARWQRQRAAAHDLAPSLEGPSRLEWRGALTAPIAVSAFVSASAQCGFERPRAACDMSVVITRALLTRRHP